MAITKNFSLPNHPVIGYFQKIGEKHSELFDLFFQAAFRLNFRDNSDPNATYDRIAGRSIVAALESNKGFKNYAKLNGKTFERNVSERSKPFSRSDRLAIKQQAIVLQSEKFTEKISKTVLNKATRKVASHLGLIGKSFKPVSVEEAAKSLKMQTSAGFHWFVKKGQVLDDIIKSTKWFISNFNPSILLEFPVYISYRVQQRPSGCKLRLIYVYSGILVVMEQMFLTPLLKHFLGTHTPYVIGNVGSDLLLRYNYWQERRFVVSLDWEAFDWRLSSLAMKKGFGILKDSFRLTPFQSQLFDFLAYYFIHTLVVTNVPGSDDFRVVRKQRGLPSGSSFTNLMGTIANMIVVYSYLLSEGFELDRNYMAFLGDDTIFATNKVFSLKHFAKWALENFGMVLSVPKSIVFKKGERVYFLGASIDSNGRYANPALLMYQIALTTSDLFVKCKTSKDHIKRLWDKTCSICFKYSDGFRTFDAVWPEIERYLGISYYSYEYKEVFSRATVPGSSDDEVGKPRNFESMRVNGWLIQ